MSEQRSKNAVSDMLRTALKKIKGWLFKEIVIVNSQPFRSQDKWQILQGDLVEFRFEEFPSRDEAEHAARFIVNAASMGRRAKECQSNHFDF
jgi:shikimate 5-dehydrogenase